MRKVTMFIRDSFQMLFYLIIIVCLASLIISCNGEENTVGVIIYNENDPFMNVYARQIESLAENTFTIEMEYSQNSQIIQNDQIITLTERGMDVLLINPVDRLGAYAIIKKLRDKEIPVVFFNREPLIDDLMLWDKAFYVGARAEQSGQLQAQLVMELFGNNPDKLNKYDKNGDNIIQAIILKGEQGHQDAEIRTVEVERAFQERGFALEILITEVANWNQEQAYHKTEQIVKQFGETIEVVLSNNDAMALGAIRQLKESGYFYDSNGDGKIGQDDSKWIPVVGIDGLSEAVQEIEAGYLYGTVLNDSQTQAEALVELTEYILGLRSEAEMHFDIENKRYIWVDYRVFTLE